jgi:antitoxin Phd
MTLHDYGGGRSAAARISATVAKNEFGRVLERVIQGGAVVITKHDTPKAVLISIDEFEVLSRANETKLAALTGEFDALLARMQAPGGRARMQAAFDASPKKLGKAAVAAARKRG